MRALPILAVLLFIAVLGAGLWLTGRSHEEAAAELERAAVEQDSGSVSAPARMVTPSVPDESGEARAAVEPEPERAAAATGTVASPERSAPASARLTGRVIDDVGRPIAGARVRADDPRQLLSLREPTRVAVETTTDDSGRFELEVAPGEQEVRVDADTFAPDRKHVTVKPAARQDLGDWALDPGVVLSGIVLDPQRRPVEGAAIHRPFVVDEPGFTVLTSERGPLVTTTGADGRFRIASQEVGEYRFLVWSEAFPDASFQGATELPGERVDGIEVVFEPGAEIVGRVIDAPAEELEELVVRAFPMGQERRVILDFSTDVPTQEMRQCEVAADGSFRLRGLQVAEEYRLTARVPGGDFLFEGSRTRPVVVASGERGVELEYSPGGTLAFQVVDSTSGDPITDFRVEAGSRLLQPLVGESGRAIEHHPEGRVRFPGLRVDAGDRLTLIVHAVGYEEHRLEDLELEAGEVKDLGTLRLRRIPVVRVIATDPAGDPVVGARVTLAPVRQETPGVRRRSISMRREVSEDGGEAVMSVDDGSRSGRTDENGVCELSSFPGETCDLRVASPGFAPYRSDPLHLSAVDDLEHSVRMTAGGIVEIQVLDFDGAPVAGAMVEHRSQQAQGTRFSMSEFEAPRVSGDDGVVRFDFLEAGQHLFRLDEKKRGGTFAFVSDDGGEQSTEGWEVVDVQGGETYSLTLIASPRASLVGRVTEGGEPLAGATVRLRSEDDSGHSMGMEMLGGGGSSQKTAPDGSFEFGDEAAGVYKLEISHASRAMPYEVEVDLRGGSNRENVDLPVTVVSGRVVDLEGEPVVGAVVQAKRYEGGGQRRMMMMMTVSSDGGGSTMITSGGAPPSTALTDADGRYELRGVEPEVDIVIEVSSDDHKQETSEPVSVPPGEVEEGVDLALTPAGRITVLATRDGQPTGNQLVRANFVGESDEPVSPEIAVMQGDGKVELTGLQAGPWSVKVSGFDNPNGDGAPEQTVEVVAGETREAVFEL